MYLEVSKAKAATGAPLAALEDENASPDTEQSRQGADLGGN